MENCRSVADWKASCYGYMVTYLENWVNFLISFYKNHGYLPDYYPEAGGPSKQPTYDDFPIICLYCASLCELRMAGMNIKGMDTLIDWCIQYIRNMYIVVAGKPEHVFNGGISQKPALDDEHTDHQQGGEFYGYQAGEILRALGLYMQYKRGIKENVWFDINYVESEPTSDPDPEPTEPDPVEPEPEEPETPIEEDPVVTPTEPTKTELELVSSKISVTNLDVANAWTDYKSAYYNSSSGYILDSSQNAAHSESTGYGLMFAVASGDRTSFDLTLNWANTNLYNSEKGLYCWRYLIEGSDHTPDKNNATDGDILIAWALIKAAIKWQNQAYLDKAKTLISNIKTYNIKSYEGYTFLLPGWTGYDHSEEEKYKYVVINPSYYIYGALRDFYLVTQDEIWNTLITDSNRITTAFMENIAPNEKIMPDWFTIEEGGTFNWDPNHTRQSGWDAIRCPMYAYWYSADHSWVKLWKDWYATKGNTLSSIPAGIDIVSSGIADAMYSNYTGFKAVFNLVANDSAEAKVSKSSYYLDSLEFMCWLAKNHW